MPGAAADQSADTLHEVAFDESGNTGWDLLNEDQPSYVLASVRVPDELGAEVANLFSPLPGEAKFGSLRKSHKGRQLVRSVLTLVHGGDYAKTYIVHKRFMVTAKMVDLLIEPLLHSIGHDLYQHGEHIALANMWFQLLPVLCSQAEFEKLLQDFVDMIRLGGPDETASFYETAERFAKECSEPQVRENVEMLLATKPHAIRYLTNHDSAFRRDDLDPAGTCLVALSVEWGRQLQSSFLIVHDKSDVIDRWTPIFRRLIRPDLKPRLVGYDDRKFELPLRAKDIVLVESDQNLEVQLADVIAGSTAHVANALMRGIKTQFVEELQEDGVLDLIADTLQPISLEDLVEKGQSPGLGINPIEAAGEIMFGADNAPQASPKEEGPV